MSDELINHIMDIKGEIGEIKGTQKAMHSDVAEIRQFQREQNGRVRKNAEEIANIKGIAESQGWKGGLKAGGSVAGGGTIIAFIVWFLKSQGILL